MKTSKKQQKTFFIDAKSSAADMKETVKEGAEEAKPIVDDAAKETKSAAKRIET